ncbi:hypothetical protein BEWA_032330 [Theileria equi strain WA]|uniref:Uncharacterized protein n=1 Tax=Theileria equi strain WA TaxID=1537102 RepID=L0AXW4_THEEQ|nr:hypothetical protein BEWA_032330 [Theileria equi strain WA]AFZ80380.1 hypothetical protein BEWA_032330 [Theileria equi strain WA]|eukprot:XP_004830046.1 hypothetical protein BEWA_032330 [Theileria equi strain WA]
MARGKTVDVDIYRGYDGDDKIQYFNGRKCYTSNNGKVFISQVFGAGSTNYKQLIHTPEDGKVGTIKSQYYLQFVSQPSNETSLTVFYSKDDIKHETPLIVQFGENNYYITSDSTHWRSTGNIGVDHIKKKLDEQNCKRRGYHVIDISKTGNQPYPCPSSCNTATIAVSPLQRSDYSYYTHTIHGNIGELRENEKEQTGFNLIGRISNAYVYWSQWETKKPLLIYLSDGKWYKRKGLDESIWETVSTNRPGTLSDSTNISKILIEYYSPTVTINVGDGRGLEDRGSTTYKDQGSLGREETINITRHDIKLDEGSTEYTSFVNYVNDRPGFKTREIKHNSNTLDGIKPDYPLYAITAYYFGQDPSDEKKLLLVELKLSGGTTFKYYQKDKNGNNWTELNRGEKGTDRLQNKDLKDKLDALKREHVSDPPASGPSAGAKAGYSTAGVMTPLATAEAVNYTLDTGWSIIRRVLAIFTAVV